MAIDEELKRVTLKCKSQQQQQLRKKEQTAKHKGKIKKRKSKINKESNKAQSVLSRIVAD